MSNTKLTESAKQMLIGRTIIGCGDDYIKLDNGLWIYLDEAEMANINSNYEDETANQ